MESKSYIIRLDQDAHFLTALRGGVVYGTLYPSYGTAMLYETADEVCRRIRDRGYIHAVVCNVYGNPVSADELQGKA